MNIPKLCPICGNDSIVPTFSSATLAVSFEYMHCSVSGLRAFQCNNYHFFLVVGGGGAGLERPELSERSMAGNESQQAGLGVSESPL